MVRPVLINWNLGPRKAMFPHFSLEGTSRNAKSCRCPAYVPAMILQSAPDEALFRKGHYLVESEVLRQTGVFVFLHGDERFGGFTAEGDVAVKTLIPMQEDGDACLPRRE